MRIASMVIVCAGLVAATGTALGQIGSVDDLYLMGDGSSEVYQYKLDGSYVAGNYAGGGSAPGPVFSNSTQQLSGPYLAEFGGTNAPNNFFVGNFGTGLVEINGLTGAFIRKYGTATRALDSAIAPDGTLYAASDLGIERFVASGGFAGLSLGVVVPDFSGFDGNDAIIEISDDGRMFYTDWNTSGTSTIYEADLSGNTITTYSFGFAAQDIEFIDGELYVTAGYTGSQASAGIYQWNTGSGMFDQLASMADSTNIDLGSNTVPHGFDIGPDGKWYMSTQPGSVEVFNADGTFSHTLANGLPKLTDVTLKPIPTPGVVALFGLAGAVATRRRRG